MMTAILKLLLRHTNSYAYGNNKHWHGMESLEWKGEWKNQEMVEILCDLDVK